MNIDEEEWEEISTDNTETLKNALERIKELEKENAELKEEIEAKQVVLNDFKSRVETVTGRFNRKSSQLTRAKELIKNIIRVTWGEGWSYSLDWKVKAEQFLKEVNE